MSNRKNIGEQSEKIVAYLDNNAIDRGKGNGPGRDVSNEPRVPKGNPDGGQWTTGGGAGAAGAAALNGGHASHQGRTVTIIHPDGSTEIRNGGSRAWRNNNPGNLKAGTVTRR
jgi:hypothetical protein